MTTFHPRPHASGRVALDGHLPVDQRLGQVYRSCAGLVGVFLVAFGILGLTDRIGFFATGGNTTLGLSTNGALSVLSLMAGCILLAAAVRGGNAASTVNMALGIAFLLAGFASLFALDSRFNVLNLRMQKALFRFEVGLLLMTGGMYGRVSGGLPHDNPYWRNRHENR
ncbi:DUF4383 domain-containing protein [Streptomyces sp. NPDC050400]|uniref:DUF4383 domain-containing protein n=1 Tax=Streptomyces sp. NPDC050400 TaxID=3365610 RepID=UPI003794349B